MARRYGRPIPAVLLWLHVLSGFVCGVEPQTDVKLLELGASIHQANLETLRTWSGRVMITTSTGLLNEAEGSSTRADAVAYVDFAYDRSRQATRWVWCDDAEKSASEDNSGIESSQDGKAHLELRNGLIKDGELYHSDAKTVTTTPLPNGSPSSFWIESLDGVNDRPMGWDFDPMNCFTAVGKSLPRRWRSICEAARKGADLSDMSVTRDGARIVLEFRRPADLNRTTIDLSQGGLLTAYDATSSGVTGRWRFQNIEVARVWVPKEITYELLHSSTPGGRKSTIKWVWLENRVNEPLGEDEFSLVRLGAKRGDIVTDVRSGARTTLTGDEYPEPDGAQPKPRGNSFLLPLALSAVLVVLLGVALLIKRRTTGGDGQ